MSRVTAARRASVGRGAVQGALPLDTIDEDGLVVYRMVLPFLPPSKNEFDGWMPTWKSSAKKKWKRHIALRAAELGMPVGCHRVGLAAKLVFPTNARRDPQNYANCLWNWVPDALQECGVLLDDRDGRVDFPSGLGVRMVVDTRATAPKKHRQRTVLAISIPKATVAAKPALTTTAGRLAYPPSEPTEEVPF